MSSDRIMVNGLRALGRHGCLPEEQDRHQPFEVDLEMELSLDVPARLDDLETTVDYGSVIMSVRDLIESRHFFLLEALAGAISDVVLRHERVEAVTVTVRKLRPPVAADVASVGVRLRRVNA
jgi:dihydroneopterin aldolase